MRLRRIGCIWASIAIRLFLTPAVPPLWGEEFYKKSYYVKAESDTPPQSGWLDEWGRLKGGHPVVLASR
jgi:hypothetical protein